jgi:hypothetical protein
MRPQKITFGEMREMGVRGVLVYCADYHCSHSVAMNADCWADDVRLSISNRASSAPPAASVERMSGRTSTGTSRRPLRWVIDEVLRETNSPQ